MYMKMPLKSSPGLQVSRMLLGGMSVIGIYVWASEGSFKATSPSVLSQVPIMS
jgi:hypothetical protein